MKGSMNFGKSTLNQIVSPSQMFKKYKKQLSLISDDFSFSKSSFKNDEPHLKGLKEFFN
jgi:hypothetical protein